MVTDNDPNRCFAPLEVIERLLEVRVESGYEKFLFVSRTEDLVLMFDAYGFGVYSLTKVCKVIVFGNLSMKVIPFTLESESQVIWH